MRKLLVLLFFQAIICQWYNTAAAQQNVEENTKPEGLISRVIYHPKVAIKFDYFGELVLHPGFSFGTDYTLSAKRWVTVHWDTEIGGYWHRWNHSAVFAKSSIGTRFPIWSMFVDLNAGVGYMHSFPAGKIYKRSEDGGLEKATNWGHPHFIPNCSVLLGWDGSRKKDLPFTVHVGVEAYLQSAFNHVFLPHMAAKVGMTYKFRRKDHDK